MLSPIWTASKSAGPRQVGLAQAKLSRLPDASIAILLRAQILNWKSRFHPADNQTDRIEDVKFRDTEVIFMSLKGNRFVRVEAEVDRIFGGNEYQLGTTQQFDDSKRNIRLDITTVDIEK